MQPLPVNKFVHLVIRKKLFELPIASVLQIADLFFGPGISSDAFDGYLIWCHFVETAAVEAEIDSEMSVHPLSGPPSAFVADSVERVLKLGLEEGFCLFFGDVVLGLHYADYLKWWRMC